MTLKSTYNTIIIGAGQNGISLSCKLKSLNVDHVVLEKGLIGNIWITQRWDSFKLVTPSSMNTIENNDTYFSNHNDFISAREFQKYLYDKSEQKGLPIIENCEVLCVKTNSNGLFVLNVNYNSKAMKLFTKKLVVASGCLNTKMIPSFSNNLPNDINQIHTSDYKSVNDITDGNTIVVGSGQSGMQIANEISSTGRVILLTSKVGCIPRRYFEKDIEEWFIKTGQYDQIPSLAMKEEITETNPFIIDEIEPGKRKINWNNIELAGSLFAIDKGQLHLNNDLFVNISYQKEFYHRTLLKIDEIRETRTNVSIDFPELPYKTNTAKSISLVENNINNIIWATGFKPKFDFLKLNVFDRSGHVIHKNGITPIKGLYFLGLPWMRTKKSGIIYGTDEDSKFIADELLNSI